MSTLQTTILKHPDSASNNIQFDSSGNVGIKVADPNSPLTILADSNANSLNVRGRPADDIGQITLLENDGTTEIGRIQARQEFLQLRARQSGQSITFVTNGVAERMRLDDEGRLLIGATSPPLDEDYAILQLVHSSSPGLVLARNDNSISVNQDLGSIRFLGNDAGTYNQCAKISAEADASHTAISKPTSLRFFTCPTDSISATERMRLKHSGTLEVKSNTARQASFGILNDGFHNAENFIQIYAGSTDHFLLLRACNANDGTPILDSHVSGSRRIEIEADGDIFNQNDVYGQLSDAKLKENIVDVSSQWDDIKALRVRNFNFREDLGYQPNTQIGFVAQEVEQVSPGLVKSVTDSDSDGNDLGTKTKVVKTSVLHVKAVKALQEAMARIEELEAKVAALEAG